MVTIAVVLGFPFAMIACGWGGAPMQLRRSPIRSDRLTMPLVCQQQREVTVSAVLDDRKVEALFAWLSRAFAGDARYNNLSECHTNRTSRAACRLAVVSSFSP